MASKPSRQLRCAIYTRKSSEEGLEQEFNSLDAQREACEAYIGSQRHEGWRRIDDHYDDGGYSGGSMERPALEQLLADIGARKVDVVVVYKVDRLTRSLSDFARIVEKFDQQGVSFVSVTQQFNTTSSMGRLTLNVLLSFAQFEREVTGERIRDKFAASRRKGMWMGGTVPLGYDLKDRKLLVNLEEAGRVNHIYERYLALGSVNRLQAELDRDQIRSKTWVTVDGKRREGTRFSTGILYHILRNRLYRGEATHKGAVYPGEHEPIVDQGLWDRVQALLADNRNGHHSGARSKEPGLLRGVLFDAAGNRMTPSHASKAGKRYRYYMSRTSLERHARGRRIPARDVERLVQAEIARLLDDSDRLAKGLWGDDVGAENRRNVQLAAQALKPDLETPSRLAEIVRATIARVEIGETEVAIHVAREALRRFLMNEGGPGGNAGADPLSMEPDCLMVRVPARMRRCGIEIKLVIEGKNASGGRQSPDPALIKALARAHDWRRRLVSGTASSIRAIGQQEGVSETYVGWTLTLAYLAPDIIEAIMEGRQPAQLTLQGLIRRVPSSWVEQRRLFGFAPADGEDHKMIGHSRAKQY